MPSVLLRLMISQTVDLRAQFAFEGGFNLIASSQSAIAVAGCLRGDAYAAKQNPAGALADHNAAVLI